MKESSFKKTLGVFILLTLPIYVSAGLMGALNNLFSRNLSPTNNESVQSMKILAAAASPSSDDFNAERVVDEIALEASKGPYHEGDIHTSQSDQISIYVVREGDTLSQIANMFGVSVNTIKWNNDITSNTLKVGETLVILPISGVRHTVAKGETLSSIAKKYKGDLSEIAGYNGLESGSPLAVGSVIIIPDGEIVSGSASVGSKVVSGLKEIVGYFMRPITGGRRTQGIHGYNGVDLAAPLGTPIMAAADGEVIVSKVGGWNGGYGNYVVIKHSNGTQTLYAHASSNLVSVGDRVKQGETIALMGATGKATGVHVHFEIRGAKNPF